MCEKEKLNEAVNVVLTALKGQLNYVEGCIYNPQGVDDGAIEECNRLGGLIELIELEFGIKQKPKLTEDDF